MFAYYDGAVYLTALKDPFDSSGAIGKLGQNRIVLIATHVVSDVETIAREILILKKGNLLRRGPIPALLGEMKGRVWTADYDPQFEDDALCTMQMGSDGLPKLRLIREEAPQLPGCMPAAPTLEDLYLSFFADEEPARLEGGEPHAALRQI